MTSPTSTAKSSGKGGRESLEQRLGVPEPAPQPSVDEATQEYFKQSKERLEQAKVTAGRVKIMPFLLRGREYKIDPDNLSDIHQEYLAEIYEIFTAQVEGRDDQIQQVVAYLRKPENCEKIAYLMTSVIPNLPSGLVSYDRSGFRMNLRSVEVLAFVLSAASATPESNYQFVKALDSFAHAAVKFQDNIKGLVGNG